MAKLLILVTGASGFVASYIISLLLKEGYAVRGTVRAGKIESLKSAPISQNPDFALVEVNDISKDDLTSVMQGVDAVIHAASPLAGQATPEVIISIAQDGNLNVLKTAAKVGISKVVITSSWGTTIDPDLAKTYAGITLTQKDWGSVTVEEVFKSEHNPLWVYIASKILAEKAAWKFAEENALIDLATVNPPFIYGPLNDQFPVPEPARLGANVMVYSLINGEHGRPLPMQLTPLYTDVRDVATAHVRALKVSPEVGNKRFLISAGFFTWKQAAEYLQKTKPELASRLPSTADAAGLPGPVSDTDVSLAKELLGLDEYIGWEQMINDTVNSFIRVEKK
ncbi:NAD-P-binding protein [Mucidula mucida]|nr:NAD-P-binding protein [Mucidula mucida]